MGNCTGKEVQLDPGAVLDRVISQASNDDDCLLYKLANYKKGGELIEAYGVGGAVEVEKLVREQFGILMYKGGKGQIISRTEYLRWKFRNQKQVVIPVESTSATDPLGKWEDHEACWQMQYRGSLGETLLHVLIICDTRLHTRLARILIKCYPKLAVDVFEGEEYLGASALHLSIAYNNNDLVHLLLEADAAVDQRAIGSFFLPRDQQRVNPAKQTDYEGLAYLGEYPLAWTACVGNESVYNLLLDKGALPDWQDSFGNMILHMVVVTDQLGMYGYALRHPKIIASNGIANNQGLTPLTLACRLGRASVFREMLELSCREFWRYSNVTCSAYPLNALDTISPDGRTNWNSALFMILAGSKVEHLNMLDGGIIQRLLEEKWKTFAQGQFLKRISIAGVHLLAMSISIYLRPEEKDRGRSLLEYHEVSDLIRMGFEAGTIASCISYVVFQQGQEIKNQGFMSFIKQLPHAPPKAIFIVANFLILSCIPFRIMGNVKVEEALLALAMVGSWFFMMFFAGAIKLTGPFVTMVYSMITGDMITFGIIYSIFLLAFSQAFYFLYKSHPSANDVLFSEYHTTWMALYQMTLGQFSYSDLNQIGYPDMAKAVFIIFMILVPILLLNMLIAMMGNTYSQVIERSEKEWVKQWAKIVVSLERAISQEMAKQYIQEYSIKLGGSDPSIELRGVMVIKSKSKTRANQRKGAVSNWKRVGKVTIHALKRRGMTGEEMRILMWGHRTSICTPQTVTPRQHSMDTEAHQMQTQLEFETLGEGLDTALTNLVSGHSQGIISNSPNNQSGTQSLFGCFDESLAGHLNVTGGSESLATPRSTSPLESGVNGEILLNISNLADSTNPTAPIKMKSVPLEPSRKVPNMELDQSTTRAASVAASPQTFINKPQLKIKRRNITIGLRPKIIIFSDKKDLIRVSLDSDESESDFSDLLSHVYKPHRIKSARRKSIAGDSINLTSSRESLRGDTDIEEEILATSNTKAVEYKPPPEPDGGNLNLAFEPDPDLLQPGSNTDSSLQPDPNADRSLQPDPNADSSLQPGPNADSSLQPALAPIPIPGPSKPPGPEKEHFQSQKKERPKSAKIKVGKKHERLNLTDENSKSPVNTIQELSAEPEKEDSSSDGKSGTGRHKKTRKRSKSAKHLSKTSRSRSKLRSGKPESLEEEKGPRPQTAFEHRSTKDISNMSKLIAWDRPEDNI